jgi:Protein of unknown function (DUF3892)
MTRGTTDYQIVCVEKEPDHGHLTHIGVTTDGGSSVQLVTLTQALIFVGLGVKYHTGTVNTGDYASVTRLACPRCGRATLRSHADATKKNNLDELGTCL